MKLRTWALVLLGTPAMAQTLTLEEALQTARDRQPTLVQARASTDAALARVESSRSGLLPQLTGALGYSRTTSNFAPQPGAVPNSLQTSGFSLETSNFFSSSLRLNQLIFDFGGTWQRWRASEASARAVSLAQASTVNQVLLQVRTAYFQVQAAHALVGLAEQQLKTQEAHLAQVQGYVDVGARPAIDLAQSRTARANARLAVITAQGDELTAKAQLNQAMGLEQGLDWSVAETAFAPVEGEQGSTDALLTEALGHRPEFQALDEQLHAQELTELAIAGGYWPSFSATAGLTANGRALDALGVNVSVGLNANWQIFSGLQTRGQQREAQANLVALRAQRDGLRQQVRLEVESARLQVVSSREAVSAAHEVTLAATEGLTLAQGRYQTGVGTQLELADALVALAQANAQEIRAQLTLATARAGLLKALGRP